MSNFDPNTAGHAPRGLCTAMSHLLCRACAAMRPGIAAQESAVFTGGCEACTAMCRALPHTRTRTHAGGRTQERNSAQWEVSRYIAAHAVQNPPGSSPSSPIHVPAPSPRFDPERAGRSTGRPNRPTVPSGPSPQPARGALFEKDGPQPHLTHPVAPQRTLGPHKEAHT